MNQDAIAKVAARAAGRQSGCAGSKAVRFTNRQPNQKALALARPFR